jgi:hypothetical protein
LKRLKNQNFGDNRDLLKFDLVCQIAGAGLVENFTYVPMLTEDITGAEEMHICRHEATGGSENKQLMDFLDNAIINEKRNIGQLGAFFDQCGVKSRIYKKDTFFTPEGRETYFTGMDREMLTRSLIMIDPDIGLEEETNGPGHLLYADLDLLYNRMDQESFLMFTQRFPDDLYYEYLGRRTAEIKERIEGSQPVSLDDLDSIIFFLTKNTSLQSRLMQVLGEYIQKYAVKAEEEKRTNDN